MAVDWSQFSPAENHDGAVTATLKPPTNWSQFKPVEDTSDHSTIGDLGRRALGAAATGAGELVQAYGDIGKKVEQALPFTATLHRAQGITPQGVQDIAKRIQDYGERESANVSPEYAKKTSVGLTEPGGLNVTNLADKAVTTVAGMAPALAGTVAASALGGPAAGIAAGTTLFGLQGEAAGRNAGTQQVAALTDPQLEQIPAYQNYRKAGLSPAQARAKFSEDVANRQALTGGAFGAGLGLVGEIPGVNAAGKAIASKLVRPIGARAAQAVGKGVAEGAGFAGINAAGQVVNNVTNPIPTPATQGVGEAAASGLLPGFVLGGARGVLTRSVPLGRADDTAKTAAATTPEPNPGAAAGSLSDAANVLHRTAPAPATETQPATNAEPSSQGEGLRLRVEPIAVPWVDKATGEATPPSDNQVLAALHAMRDQADAIKDAGNKPTMSTPQVAAAWGIAPDRLRKLQSAMSAERRKGVTTSDAEARAAQEPQLPIEPENPVDTLRATGAGQDARLRDLQNQFDQTGETLANIRARLQTRQQTAGSENTTSNDVAKPKPADAADQHSPTPAAERAGTQPEDISHVEQQEPQQTAASSASGGTGRAGGEAATAPAVEVRTAHNAEGATAERTAGNGEGEAGQAEPVATPPAAESGAARAEATSASADQQSIAPGAKAAEAATAEAATPPAAAPKPAEPKPSPQDEPPAVAEQQGPSEPASEPAGPAAAADRVPSSKPSKQPVTPETTANVVENQENVTKQTPQQQFEANKAAIKAVGFQAGDRVSFMANGKRVEGTIAKGDKAGLAKDQGMLKVLVTGRNGNADYTVGARNLTKLENGDADVRVGRGGVATAAQGEQASSGANPSSPGEGEAQAPLDVEGAALESAAHPENARPEPTPAQHEAGNFKMGHVNLHGLDVTIEVPKGGTRRGTDRTGKPWERPASDHYGYVRRTEGADGEQVDVYLGPHAEDPKSNVFVIDQVKPGTKAFDEHKAMVGFKTGREARASYDANFPKGMKTFGGIRKMSMDTFKDWVKHGDTTKPVSDKVRARATVESESRQPQKVGNSDGEATREPRAEVRSGAGDGRQESAAAVESSNGARLRSDTGRNLSVAAGDESLGRVDGRAAGRGSQSRPLKSSPAPARGRLARSDVQRIVDRTTAEWGDNQPRVIVKSDAEGLPESAKADPGYKSAEGYYDPRTGTAYLVASNLRSEHRAMEVLAHEAIGHHGIENVVDHAFGAGAMQKITDAVQRLDAGGKASDTMRAVLQETHRRYSGADPTTFAKEFLAISAEKGIRNAFLDRVVTAIRKFLRQIMPKLQLNERELRQSLVQAERYVRESAAPGARAAREAATAFSNKPDTFYSALTEAVAAGKGAPKKAEAIAWKQWLDGAQRRGEFKGAEREWMGLDQWLDSRQGPITRAALVQHVRDSQVRVQEVMRRDEIPMDEAAGIHENEDGTFELVDHEGAVGESTKFGDYVLPGGKNYRELLLTLPQRDALTGGERAELARLTERKQAVELGRPGVKPLSAEEATRLDALQDKAIAGNTAPFHSGHFDEPNIVAHVRMNDRIGPDGEKILHVEEVQSDWHQLGRKKGYVRPEDKYSSLPRGYKVEPQAPDNGHPRFAVFNPLGDRVTSRHPTEDAAIAEALDRLNRESPGLPGVPDAPFKKEWPMLAMKRVLRYAAEHGYDKVTWTTGEQQAARYDLSKQVDSIQYVKQGDDKYHLEVGFKNAPAHTENEVGIGRIEELLGKEMAAKIEAGEGESVTRKAPFSGKEYEQKKLAGTDLKMGGEGMKAFYDKMLPNEIAKYVKKWGAKVEDAVIGDEAARLQLMSEAMPGATPAERMQAAIDGTLPKLRKVLGGNAVSVHGIDITPAMRESVLQGQPLFSQRALTLNDPDVERRDALRDMPAIAQSDALAKYSGAALRTHAKASFDAARAAGPVHMMDGADVQFSRTGWREVNQHSADRRVLDVMPNIRELMQRAVPLWEDAVTDPSKPNLRAFRHYGVKVRGPDGDYYARFVVRAGKDGRYHYDHDAISTTALNDEGPARQPIRQPKPGEDATSLAKNRLAQWWRGVNAAMPEAPKPSFSRPEPADAERPSDPSREPHKTVKDIEAVLRHGDPAGVRDKAKAWLRGKFEDFRPAMLGAIQTRHLLELMEDSPPLKGSGKNYERSMQQMDADRQQLMAGAPDAAEHPTDMLKKGAVTIAQEMRQYAYGKGLRALRGRVRPEAQKLFDMMHAATIQRMDPDKAYERLTIENAHGDAVPWTHEEVKARLKLLKELALQRGGDAWADREKIRDEVRYLRNIAKMERARERNWPKLQADWQALPEEAKGLYRQVRDWYSQYRDETEKALIKNIEALDMPETYRRSLVNRMRLRFEEARREGVYFPLNRDGAFWIAFRDAEGNEGFKMFESAREFEQGEKRLRAAGFQIDAKGRRDQNLQAREAPSGTFVRQVIDVLQQAKVSESVQDEVYQTFLRSLPELSMRKHAIHRKNIAGYSEDALRAFAKNGYHGAHQLARLRHAQDMGFALEAMRVSVDNWRRGENSTDEMKEPSPLDVAKADALVGEMAKRHDWIMHPTDQRLANMVNSLGFIYYLGASPASALTNLTQVAQTVLPVLGAEHGWNKATRVLGTAWRDAARTVGHMDRTLKDPDERRAFMVMQQRGDFSKTQSHTLAGLAEGNVLQTSPVWSRTMNAISWMFHTAEVINREATGMAAYRLARAKGMDFQQAIEYAGKTNADANFDYAAANRPRYMQGNVQRIAFQFKNFSIGQTWLMYRNLYQAMKGETPEIRRVARRTVTGVLGMTAILAGATGLPVYNAVRMTANAANTLWGDDNEPWNFDDAFHRWLADNLGPDAARLIAEGPTNYLTGANIASRTSLSNLWIHDDDQRLEGADAYHALLENLAGPIGGIVNNWYVGVEDVRRGHLERGVERMLPSAVKNSIKSLRYAHEGVNSLRGDPIVPDVSGWQEFLQAVGFQPAAVADQYRINTAMKNFTGEINDRRINLMNAYALAMKGGDDADLGAALRKINAFNQAHPEVAITAKRLGASLRQRARLSAQATNGVVLNKRLALQAQQYAGVAQ